MSEQPPVDDEFTRTPVPMSRSVSGFQVAMICMGITITLPALYTGGELARGLGIEAGFAAVVLGAVILGIMSVPAAVVGVRTRLSSYMIIEHVFGSVGAKFINACFGLVLLGWYAVTAEYFGRTLFLAAQDAGFVGMPEWFYCLVSSALVIATTIFGFRALDRLAVVAVPLLAFFLVGVMSFTLLEQGLAEVLALPAGEMAFTQGVSIVIGTMIVGVVLMPDFSRYARNLRDCLTASFLGNSGGIILSTTLAMVPALAYGSLDPMVYLTAMGVGALAIVLLVFATWTTNGANLYSVGLVVGSATTRVAYWQIVLATGLIGTAAALAGITDYFIEFLEILGLVVPPVASVYLVDYFLLRRTDFSEAHLARQPPIVFPALLATLMGGAISGGLWMAEIAFTGIAALESLALSALLYLAFDRIVTVLRQPASQAQ